MLASAEKTRTGTLRDEQGVEVVEYAIIVGLIVAVALVVLAAIGLWVLGVYQQLQATVNA